MEELTVAATLENLVTVTDFIHTQLERFPIPAAAMAQVDLAVEEIYVNIANYAYHPQLGNATIRCEVDPEPVRVLIEFADEGKPYNPLEKKDPDITLSVDERQVGGLGIYMVKNLMDHIDYQYRDGKNILCIEKFA